MIRYVKFSVGIHGLSAPRVEAVAARLREALVKGFDPAYDTDIEIEVEESAGPEEGN